MQKNQGNVTPYAFICYNHHDYESVVKPIIDDLRRDDYQVWFYQQDVRETDGKTRISEEIADRISNCAVFISFHSETSVQSQWCIDEIYRAYRKKKPILRVAIHDVPLNPGHDLHIGELYYIRHETHEKTLSWLEKAPPMSRCKCGETKAEYDKPEPPVSVSPLDVSQEAIIAQTVWTLLKDDGYGLENDVHPELLHELFTSCNRQTLIYSSERRGIGIASDVLYRRNGFDFTYSGIAFRHKSLSFPSEHWTSWAEFANPENTIEHESADITKSQQCADSLKFWGVAILIAAVTLLVLFLCGVKAINCVVAIIFIVISFILIWSGHYISLENIKYNYIFFLCVKQTQEKKGICTCRSRKWRNYEDLLNNLRRKIMTETEKSRPAR